MHLGNLYVNVARPRHHCVLFVLVGQLYLNAHRLTVAAQAQAYETAWRSFMDHTAQLGTAFDGSAVHAQDHVVLLETGFSGGRVLIDHGDFDAFFLFQFQGA